MSSHTSNKSKKSKKKSLFVVILTQLFRFWLFSVKFVFTGKPTAVMLKLCAAIVLIGVVAAWLGMPVIASNVLAILPLPIIGFAAVFLWERVFR